MKNSRLITAMVMGACLTGIVGMIVSCNSSTKSSVGKRECYVINPEEEAGQMNLSEYSIDSIRPLDFPEDIPEMIADKMVVVNGNILILDRLITKKLYIFNSDGTLKTVIGERGRARGEFIGELDEFFVDSNDRVHVFDQIGHRINVYNMDGSVDDVIYTDKYYPHSVGLTSTDRYMMYFSVGHKDEDNPEEAPSSLLLFDQGCNGYEKVMPSSGERYASISVHTFFPDCDRLSFIPCYSDSVYVFDKEMLEKVVSFDFGEKVLCREMPEKLAQTKDYSYLMGYKGVEGLHRYQETDALIYADYLYQKSLRFWLYNKKSGRVSCGYSLFEGINSYFYYFLNGNQIVAYVDKGIEDWKKSYDKPVIQESLKKTPQQLKDMIEGKIKAPALVYITIK